MTDRYAHNLARRRQLEADMSAKTAQLAALATDCDGFVQHVASAPQEAPAAPPALEAAPVRRLPAPNPAQGSSAAGPPPSGPPTSADKASELVRLQAQQKRAAR